MPKFSHCFVISCPNDLKKAFTRINAALRLMCFNHRQFLLGLHSVHSRHPGQVHIRVFQFGSYSCARRKLKKNKKKKASGIQSILYIYIYIKKAETHEIVTFCTPIPSRLFFFHPSTNECSLPLFGSSQGAQLCHIKFSFLQPHQEKLKVHQNKLRKVHLAW